MKDVFLVASVVYGAYAVHILTKDAEKQKKQEERLEALKLKVEARIGKQLKTRLEGHH